VTLPRVVMKVAGMVWSDWTSIEVSRDLGDLAGTVRFDARDEGRVNRMGGLQDIAFALDAGHELRIEVDGELDFLGYVEDLDGGWDADSWRLQVSARDRTGDMVDCSANPDGPAEYSGLKLDEIARRLAAPFGIPVRADVDMGDAFPKFSLDADDLVMDAIEKAMRQRGILAVSDGVGGLVLTRGGTGRAPAALNLPGNAQSGGFRRSHADLFSRYIVKGQTPGTAGRAAAGGTAALASRADPLTEGDLAAAPPAARTPTARAATRARVARRGEARDPEIQRYRPRVWLSKTESGGASLQQQAEWRLRVARGKADELTYTVLGWHAGEPPRRWRPNELTFVRDAISGIEGDMLIKRVVSSLGEPGNKTVLTVTGPEAFDLVEEGERRRKRRDHRARRRAAAAAATGGSTARELEP